MNGKFMSIKRSSEKVYGKKSWKNTHKKAASDKPISWTMKESKNSPIMIMIMITIITIMMIVTEMFTIMLTII